MMECHCVPSVRRKELRGDITALERPDRTLSSSFEERSDSSSSSLSDDELSSWEADERLLSLSSSEELALS